MRELPQHLLCKINGNHCCWLTNCNIQLKAGNVINKQYQLLQLAHLQASTLLDIAL